jgi:hypothetical protein
VDSRTTPHGPKRIRDGRIIHNGTREAMDLTNKVSIGEKRISGALAKWDEMIWSMKGIRTARAGTM